MNEELKHYGVLGMKWGISRSKEVRGVNKAYKDRNREIGDKANKYMEDVLAKGRQLNAEKKQAIKDAKRNGGREAARAVKSDYEKRMQALSDDFDKRLDKFGRDFNASKSKFKSERALAREKAANRLFKDGDEARNKRIANMNLGKAALQSFLMGSYGAKKYNQYRAAGESRGKAGVKGLAWNVANNVAYQIPTGLSNAQFIGNYVKDRRKNKRK